MPNYKVNLFFAHPKGGWSETYYKVTSDPNFAQSAALNLISRRGPLLAKEAVMTAWRISDDQLQRDSFLSRQPTYVPFSYAGVEYVSDLPFTSLPLRLANGMLYWRMLYLRGIPDLLYPHESGANPIQNAWYNKVTAMMNELANQWSLKAASKDPSIPVLDVQTIINVVAGVEMTTTLAHNLAVGDTVQVYGMRNNFTGRHQVLTIINATTVVVRGVATNVTEYQGLGKLKKIVFIYPLINTTTYGEFTHRIVGRPFGQPRGRRARIR